MQIDKRQILEALKSMGKDDKVGQADQELPEQVDTERDAGLLQKLGIDPSELVKMVTSGDLGKLGGQVGKLFGR